MDDFAPAPAQRTFDKVGPTPDENFMARKKAVKKAPAAPAPKQDPEPELEPEPGMELNHQLDLLA
jgi:hypothetical protein